MLIKESLVGWESALSFLCGVQQARFQFAVVTLVKIFPFCGVNLFFNSLALAIEIRCRIFSTQFDSQHFNYLDKKQTSKQTKNA